MFLTKRRNVCGIKETEMSWSWGYRETSHVVRILIRKRERKRPFGRPRYRWAHTNKICSRITRYYYLRNNPNKSTEPSSSWKDSQEIMWRLLSRKLHCVVYRVIRRFRVSNAGRDRKFFFSPKNIQTGSGAYPASYLMDSLSFFIGVKAAGA